MKQTRLDSFFNIKYKKDKQLINTTDKEIINNTPNNTPKYGAINNTTSINPFKLNDRINSEIPKYLLRFDGASKGNPGIAGAGAVLYENGKEIWCISRYLGIQTNNYAECFAVILGIDEACRRKIKDLEVEGDSMLPNIHPNDWVLGRSVSNVTEASDNKIYIIVLHDSVLVKKLQKTNDSSKIRLISLNQEYVPIEVNIVEIQELWQVNSKLTFGIDEPSGSNLLKELQQSMEDLKGQINSLR